MTTPDHAELIRRTVWIVQRGKHDWIALNSSGDIVANAKFKSTLAYTLRQDIGNGKFLVPGIGECFAIADVVDPTRRQPQRALPGTKTSRFVERPGYGARR